MSKNPYFSEYFKPNHLHFNHASMSPLCSPVKTAISEFLNVWETGEFRYYPLLRSLSNDIKQSIARLISCSESQISIQANVATSFSILAQGLNLRPFDEVVLVSQDFPSVTYPFLNASRSHGFTIRFIEYNDFIQDPIKALEGVWTSQTRLLAFSWVGFMSGVRADLKAIIPFCHARNARVAIDATQGLVACPFSLEDFPVDFLVASTYKWFLSPQGSSFFYVSPTLLEQLDPILSGWLAVQDPPAMVYDNIALSPNASRFENGGIGLLSLVGTRSALKFLEQANIDTIQKRTLALSKRLSDGLLALGYPLVSDYTDTNRSGIVTLDARRNGEALFAHLTNNGILTTYRLDQIRLSPYFYQCDADIDTVLDILAG